MLIVRKVGQVLWVVQNAFYVDQGRMEIFLVVDAKTVLQAGVDFVLLHQLHVLIV